MLIDITIWLVIFMICLYKYLTRHYDYWKKKGVVYIKPKFPLGVLHDLFTGSMNIRTGMLNVYAPYKNQGLKYVGSFMAHQPTLILLDLDICKNILTKDFNHFVTRDILPTTHEHMSKHLFSMEGQEWRDMRAKLTPAFSSGKIKVMFSLMEKCAQQLQEYIDGVVLKRGEFDAKDLLQRFTLDIIATCAFGLESNCFQDNDSEFLKTSKLIVEADQSRILTFVMHAVFPGFSKLVKLNFYHTAVSQLLTKIVQDNVEHRKQNSITRNDFIDLMLAIKISKENEQQGEKTKNSKLLSKISSVLKNGLENHQNQQENNHMTVEQMTAQAFAFLAAGFDTPATTTSMCLYELAKNLKVQERLRQEIDEVLSRHGGKLSYEALQEMTYLGQVMNEALRMYSSLPFLSRVCTETYLVPGTDLVIDKGVRIIVPHFAFHHDPDIYPDPFKFNPDRFSEENTKSRHPYAFLAFGEGPRICIGMRFSIAQVKLGLAAVLSKYEVTPALDTPPTIEMKPFTIVTAPKYPIHLRITRRSDL